MLLVVSIFVMWILIDNLPVIGDPHSAPHTHLSPYYIENGPKETHSPNLVTGVLADYRAFDTLLETTVMFLAGISTAMVLSNKKKEETYVSVLEANRDFLGLDIPVLMPPIVSVMILYAVYVLFHGEVSLGGGFQAGALFAMAFIIYTMFGDLKKRQKYFTRYFTVILASIGVLIYAMTGVMCSAFGGNFLQYEKLPFSVSNGHLHGIGITLIETGVTIVVAATIITILEVILERESMNGNY